MSDTSGRWQSIETAPKNRKVLAAYRNPLGNWRIVTACYHTKLPWSDDAGWDSEFAPEAWYEESDSQDSILPTSSLPTHWQPLPAPPALHAEEEKDNVKVLADAMLAARRALSEPDKNET